MITEPTPIDQDPEYLDGLAAGKQSALRTPMPDGSARYKIGWRTGRYEMLRTLISPPSKETPS